MTRTILTVLVACFFSAANALTVTISVESQAVCSSSTGMAYAVAEGGTPPYSFQWSNGETDMQLMFVPAGTYSVVVTDAMGETASASVVIEMVEYGLLNEWDPFSMWYVAQPACGDVPAHVYFGAGYASDGWQNPQLPRGPGPYTFWLGGAELNTLELDDNSTYCSSERLYFVMLPEGYDQGGGTITFADANGCSGAFNFEMGPGEMALPPIQVLDVLGSCAASPSGSVRVQLPVTVPSRSLRLRLRRDDGTFIPHECVFQWEQDRPQPVAFNQTFSKLPAGTYWFILDNDLEARLPFNSCADSVSFEIPDLGTDCAFVSGNIYVDTNGNCTAGAISSEPRVPFTPIVFEPGPRYMMTDASGNYSGILPNGTYTATVEHPKLEQSCTVGLTVEGGELNQVNLGMAPGAPLDLQARLYVGPARPGFSVPYYLKWENLSAMPPGTVTLSLTVDPMLTYVSGDLPTPTINGNTYTWTGNATSLPNAFQAKQAGVHFQVPADPDLIGTTLVAELTVTSGNTDSDLSNNTATAEREITGSYDPNDKLARTSSGETEVWVNQVDEWIDYTIRFQNTGTDTAFNVIITDTLPPTLDPSTLRWGVSSHPCEMELTGEGLLRFIFISIELPDSNVNEQKSHGLVSFRIKPHEGLAPGTLIENVANIYFDFNPPVITAPNVLEVVPPPVYLDVRVTLGGAYDPAEGLMRDNLRADGLLPGQEPYTALGYTHAGGGGGETVSPIRMGTTGDEAIVDWVVLELRDAANPATVLHSKSALLRRDGKVVATDGRSAVPIKAAEDAYYIALRHRNHLGVMTAGPVALTLAATTIDFTDAGTATWGTDAQTVVGPGHALWPGDVTFDGVVKYTGPNNDRDVILQDIGGEIPTAIVGGYRGSDVNMDGMIQYTGPDNDRDVILQVIGAEVPSVVRQMQVPE